MGKEAWAEQRPLESPLPTGEPKPLSGAGQRLLPLRPSEPLQCRMQLPVAPAESTLLTTSSRFEPKSQGCFSGPVSQASSVGSTMSTHWISHSPYSLIIIPILQVGKLGRRRVWSLAQVHTLANGQNSKAGNLALNAGPGPPGSAMYQVSAT